MNSSDLNYIKSQLKSVFKKNIIPAIVIILLELLIVILYKSNTFITSFLTILSIWKYNLSYIYSFLSTGLFMGLIPWGLSFISRKKVVDPILHTSLFMFISYGIVGIQSDALYRVQTWLFGDSGMFTVLCKMFFDQFVWTLFYMSHVNYWIIWIFNNNLKLPFCSVGNIIRYLKRDWIVGLVGGYIIWIPSCIVIYSMDKDLQMIMNNLIGVFFVIVMNTITKNEKENEINEVDIGDEEI